MKLMTNARLAAALSIFCATAGCLASGAWAEVIQAQLERRYYQGGRWQLENPTPAPPRNFGPEFEETLPHPSDCVLPIPPLASLTIDTRPVDRPGGIELRPDHLPEDCSWAVVEGVPTMLVGWNGGVGGWHWPLWYGAQFCHRPLYFEEPWLERYGYKTCCQPVASALHFYCNALLLPVKLIHEPPCGCVWTPPHEPGMGVKYRP